MRIWLAILTVAVLALLAGVVLTDSNLEQRWRELERRVAVDPARPPTPAPDAPVARQQAVSICFARLEENQVQRVAVTRQVDARCWTDPRPMSGSGD